MPVFWYVPCWYFKFLFSCNWQQAVRVARVPWHLGQDHNSWLVLNCRDICSNYIGLVMTWQVEVQRPTFSPEAKWDEKFQFLLELGQQGNWYNPKVHRTLNKEWRYFIRYMLSNYRTKMRHVNEHLLCYHRTETRTIYFRLLSVNDMVPKSLIIARASSTVCVLSLRNFSDA